MTESVAFQRYLISLKTSSGFQLLSLFVKMSFSSSTPPLFSIRSDKGRRSKMEDRHDVQLNFIQVPLDPTEMEDVIPKHLQPLARPSLVAYLPNHLHLESRTFSVGESRSSFSR